MNRHQSFATPDDFLAHLRAVYANPASGDLPDEELLTRTQNDLRALHPQFTYTPDQLKGMTLVGERLKAEVFGSLPFDINARILSNIALGVLDTGEANAAIYKSRDEKYAILLNNGLMLLLNKFFKLIIAWENPALVTYCNRKPADELTSEELHSYLPELVETYKQYGAPHGAMLKLDRSVTGRQSALLHLSELFIICHELGHFLNGDLEDDTHFSAVAGRSWLRKFQENKDHAIEYAADATGFRLLEILLKTIPGNFTSLNGLQAVISLFNLFFLLTQGESSSHPNPRSRSVKIARQFFGTDFGNTLERSYDDPELLRTLFPQR
jgi:hypothetical protein